MNDKEIGEYEFDIFWANASLIHMPKKDLLIFLENLHSLCRCCGNNKNKKDNSNSSIFGGIFCEGKGESILNGKFVPGRYFSKYDDCELWNYFCKTGWNVIKIGQATQYSRKGKWIEILCQCDCKQSDENYLSNSSKM